MPHYSSRPDFLALGCDSPLFLPETSATRPSLADLTDATSDQAPKAHISGANADPECLSKAWLVDLAALNCLPTTNAIDVADRQHSQSNCLQIPSLNFPPQQTQNGPSRLRAWLDTSQHDLGAAHPQLQLCRTPSLLSSCSLSSRPDSAMDERLPQSRRAASFDYMAQQDGDFDHSLHLQPPSSNEAMLEYSRRASWQPGQNEELACPMSPLQRTHSNSKKRSQDEVISGSAFNEEASTSIAKRILERARPKSPRVDARRSTHDIPSRGAITKGASRVRSRSDVVPVAYTDDQTVAAAYSQPQWLDADLTLDPEDDDSGAPGAFGPFPVAEPPAAATLDAFQSHIRNLNPDLDIHVLERIVQEQMKRHQRLVDFRSRHETALGRKSCPSGARCNAAGGGPNYEMSNFSTKDGPPAVFHIIQPDGSHELPAEESIPATFPDGIPIPPICRLPAEFECPLCFQVKKFMKPSDWTKHVHEDVQPFTCTFPSCAEPKSFKRKADWVRHESERHRHLESWRCEVPECWHVCYRKDNFVQHLVREHRLPEPRAKSGRVSKAAASKQDDIISQLVEKCKVESTKSAVDEPCRFCGSVCASWKKLTVHLAKHMEQISMPVLELIGHHLPRSDSGPIQHRTVAQSASLPLPAPSRNRLEHSWTMPLVGPAISITNTAGATDLEHEPSAFYQRAVSETPSYYSNAVPQYDSDTSFLHPSTSSSPYLSGRSTSLGQPSPSLPTYSSESGMLGLAPQSAWQQANAPETRPSLLQASSMWQDQLMAPSPSDSAFATSGGLAFGESTTNASMEIDDAAFQVSPDMPQPNDQEWMVRAYAAAASAKERSRGRSTSATAPYQGHRHAF